jgi:hypothetical protein
MSPRTHRPIPRPAAHMARRLAGWSAQGPRDDRQAQTRLGRTHSVGSVSSSGYFLSLSRYDPSRSPLFKADAPLLVGRSWRCTRNLVWGRGGVRRRLQPGARVLGMSGKSGGRVGGLTGGGSFWTLWPFGWGIAPLLKTLRLTGSNLVCSDELLGRIEWLAAMRGPGERRGRIDGLEVWDGAITSGSNSPARALIDPANNREAP